MFEAKKTRVYMILLSETTCTLLAACAIPMVNPPRIVAEGAKWEEVSRDGLFTAEGVVAARDGMIYATAITRPEAIKQNNPGGTIYRYDPSTGVTTTSRSTQTRRLALSVRGHERKREMNQVVVLEWTFSPTHYFEQTIEVRQDEYTLKIENGKAAARVAPRAYDADPNYRLALHEALFAEPGHFKITGGSVDFLVKDKDGNVLADTRTDRIEKKQHFANLAEKYRDTDRVLYGLLNSYTAAVKDPTMNWCTCTRSERRSQPSRQRRGREDSPKRKQGKLVSSWATRGKKVGNLRDATEGELNEARSIARFVVDSNLTWFNNNG